MTIDRRTVENLLRTSHQENRQALASQKRDYERRISQLKGEQKKTLVRFTQSSRQARKKAKREAEEKARQDRILFEQEFSRLKAAYQTNLTQLKEFYTRQNVAGLNELRVLLSDYAEEAKKHFNNAIEDQRSQMHEVQAWLQNELPRQLLQLSSEQVDDSGIAEAEMIEEALDTDSLSREIQARDELIEKAGARIRSLEEKLAPKQGKTLWKRMRRSSPPEPYKDEEPTDP
ncbi:MAG TPA: hypothetical protein VJP79_05685, partial [Nitrososphaera sp.]|nr:hypothetical protein [Nitrososphaera sp.]